MVSSSGSSQARRASRGQRRIATELRLSPGREAALDIVAVTMPLARHEKGGFGQIIFCGDLVQRTVI